jgi:hypothetical protein
MIPGLSPLQEFQELPYFLLVPFYLVVLMLAATSHCLIDLLMYRVSNGRHKVKARTRRETRGL